MTTHAVTVAERLAALRDRIDSVAGGRPVTVVAVTKGFGAGAVAEAVAAGLRDVGENYAQELLAKAEAVQADGVRGVRWHFIGKIQRNKVHALAPLVGLWQTVDRVEVAEAISRHAPGASILVQVDLTGGSGRAGCAWDDVDGLVDRARGLGLDVQGLMGVGPAGPPEHARPGFARLAACAHALGLGEISMGMSGDLEVALGEGSTMVRVGTALFGPRPDRADLRR